MILAHENKKYKSLSQGRDGSGPVVSSEDGTAGDEEGRTGVFDGLDGLGIDAAINFDDSRRIAGLFQERLGLADLIDGIGNELLAAEAGLTLMMRIMSSCPARQDKVDTGVAGLRRCRLSCRLRGSAAGPGRDGCRLPDGP